MRFEIFGLRFEINSLASIRARRLLPTPKQGYERIEEASDDFWNAFQFGGTLVATCRCGRTNFCSDTDLDFEEGELESLLAKATIEPDKYVHNAMDSSVAVIDGPNGLLIWGCPCHSSSPYEQFLIEYRSQILDYYRRRLEADQRNTGRAAEELETAR